MGYAKWTPFDHIFSGAISPYLKTLFLTKEKTRIIFIICHPKTSFFVLKHPKLSYTRHQKLKDIIFTENSLIFVTKWPFIFYLNMSPKNTTF